jgi:hypothetical protein
MADPYNVNCKFNAGAKEGPNAGHDSVVYTVPPLRDYSKGVAGSDAVDISPAGWDEMTEPTEWR